MSTTNNSDQSDKAWTLSHISAIKINYSQHWVSNHQNPVTRHTLQKRAWIISNSSSYLCKTLRFLRSCSSTSISFNFFVIRLTLDWSENFSLIFFPNSSFPISLTKRTFHVIIMFLLVIRKIPCFVGFHNNKILQSEELNRKSPIPQIGGLIEIPHFVVYS